MNDTGKRFRVAFSFAGEKRDFVAQVAAILAAHFSKAAILYDKYHEAEFARRDLGLYLPNLYHDQSDLVVVVVCQDYQQKEWCGLEWHAIFALLKRRKDSEVMLCRFDHATVPGLYDIAGFVELDDNTPDQAATLVLERLALNEGEPKDYYTKPSSADQSPERDGLERASRSRQLAEEARWRWDRQPDLAVLLTVEACCIATTQEALESLLTGLLAGHFSPESRSLQCSSDCRVTSLLFSPDGSVLASGSEDGTVILWDVSTARRRGQCLTGHRQAVRALAFSPDGSVWLQAAKKERSSCGMLQLPSNVANPLLRLKAVY
jgi:hypothetical protein